MANNQVTHQERFSTFNKGESLATAPSPDTRILPRLDLAPIFCDNNTAQCRLETLLMSNQINGPWEYSSGKRTSKMYIAGGAVARCFRGDFTMDGYDIDIYFASGDSQTAKDHAMSFLRGLIGRISVLRRNAPGGAVSGYSIFYGKSTICEIHSPYLHNTIQIIPVQSDTDGPEFLKTFDFSHIQLCYYGGSGTRALYAPPASAGSGFIFTSACQDAYRTGTTAPNPLCSRIHAYRYVKASLQGWNISQPEDQHNFIANYNTCNYHMDNADMRRVHYDVNCKVWLPSNMNIVEMSKDPTILANLARKKFVLNPHHYLVPSVDKLKQDYLSIFDDIEVFTLDQVKDNDSIMKYRHSLHQTSNVNV
jgi:hypothetical protein